MKELHIKILVSSHFVWFDVGSKLVCSLARLILRMQLSFMLNEARPIQCSPWYVVFSSFVGKCTYYFLFFYFVGCTLIFFLLRTLHNVIARISFAQPPTTSSCLLQKKTSSFCSSLTQSLSHFLCSSLSATTVLILLLSVMIIFSSFYQDGNFLWQMKFLSQHKELCWPANTNNIANRLNWHTKMY